MFCRAWILQVAGQAGSRGCAGIDQARDRLGRNAMDVRVTMESLAGAGVPVHCLALGGVDLTSPAGKVAMGAIAAVAEFERALLIEADTGQGRRKDAGASKPPQQEPG